MLKTIAALGVVAVTAFSAAFALPVAPRDYFATDYVSAVGIMESGLPALPGEEVEFMGHGSGVFVTPKRFLTAKHVSDSNYNPEKIASRIRMADGTIYTIVGVENFPKDDIALVTIKEEYKGHLPRIDCTAQRVGTQLVNVGSPLSLEFLLSHLMVANASIRKDLAEAFGSQGLVIFQGQAIPGQSGSPVYTEAGGVTGVMVMTIIDSQRGGSYTGYGLYVSVNSFCEWITKRVN